MDGLSAATIQEETVKIIGLLPPTRKGYCSQVKLDSRPDIAGIEDPHCRADARDGEGLAVDRTHILKYIHSWIYYIIDNRHFQRNRTWMRRDEEAGM